jgi:hypothetical protein
MKAWDANFVKVDLAMIRRKKSIFERENEWTFCQILISVLSLEYLARHSIIGTQSLPISVKHIDNLLHFYLWHFYFMAALTFCCECNFSLCEY